MLILLIVLVVGFLTGMLSLYNYGLDLYSNSQIYELQFVGLFISTFVSILWYIILFASGVISLYASYASLLLDNLSGQTQTSRTSRLILRMFVGICIFIGLIYFHYYVFPIFP